LPYYENPGILARQIETWNAYDEATREAVNVVLVDDGSPRNPALDVLRLFPCKVKIGLWRVIPNIPWNQHGARNLAAKVAGEEDGRIVMTDMDHLLEPAEARKVVETALDPARHYTFNRISLPERLPYKVHCNSFLVTRGTYWQA